MSLKKPYRRPSATIPTIDRRPGFKRQSEEDDKPHGWRCGKCGESVIPVRLCGRVMDCACTRGLRSER